MIQADVSKYIILLLLISLYFNTNLYSQGGQSTITVIEPVSGDSLIIGGSKLVRWDTSNGPDSVKIEYSTDGGENWIVIESTWFSYSNGRTSYLWKEIPGPASSNCRIKISDWVDGDPSGESDTFVIYASSTINVNQPNGSEKWRIGSSEKIIWSSEGSDIPSIVRLTYSTDGGQTWNTIDPGTTNDGEYVWQIPDKPSKNCLVSVSDVSGEIEDISDQYFYIYRAMTVNSPTEGTNWEVGSNQTISWISSGISSQIDIEISRDNGITWQFLKGAIEDDGSETWQVEMPRSDDCLLKITDTQDDDLKGQSRKFSIIAQDTSELRNPTAQPGGSEQSAYRLISIPLQLNNPRPIDVLADDLGTYNPNKWRFFDYIDNQYVEYPDTRDFEPGRSFFLITKNSKTIDAGAGNLVADSLVTVALDSGWNFVANPYNFSIIRDALSINRDLTTYTASEGWLLSSAVTELQPWAGYALKADEDTVLEIRPVKVLTKPAEKNHYLENAIWMIQIEARCQQAKDLANYIGVSGLSIDEWDTNDYHEPPPIGAYIMIYFPHADWQPKSGNYTTDFRPNDRNGYIWNMEVRSNIEDKIDLTFSGLDRLPEHWTAFLCHNLLRIHHNLKEDNQYSFYNIKKNHINSLQIIIGKHQFIEDFLQNENDLPFAYQLDCNFPNPFNTSTTIRYALPRPQEVSIKIYNLLGEHVRTLIDNKLKEAGYHHVTWNGCDETGRLVGSGLYIYQLQTNTFTSCRKMLLIK